MFHVKQLRFDKLNAQSYFHLANTPATELVEVDLDLASRQAQHPREFGFLVHTVTEPVEVTADLSLRQAQRPREFGFLVHPATEPVEVALSFGASTSSAPEICANPKNLCPAKSSMFHVKHLHSRIPKI